ncbi:hypothetical protein SAMN05421538_102337 [Paracoccus isoporae]|uniref:Uncharacterized protein n=1 Tax=Paracoccus isoporae TaxID=591205 RepID=A0A1G6X9M5_9RHOB|nr:hypothetical protein SAMN05421538_102337 [Paracoccus isoporae]
MLPRQQTRARMKDIDLAKTLLPVLLGAALILAGCGDRSGDYPALLPSEQILAEPAIPGHAEIAASSPDQVVSDLQNAGAALAVSSAEVTAAQSADAQALTARAEALRRRAAELARTAPE